MWGDIPLALQGYHLHSTELSKTAQKYAFSPVTDGEGLQFEQNFGIVIYEVACAGESTLQYRFAPQRQEPLVLL